MPDLLAVNGPAARGVMTEAGFPAERLADVEALRYLDLPRFDVRPAADPERARIIVLGDSSPAGTRSLLALVAATAPLLPAGWRFTLKPHPLHPVRAADFPGLNEFGETDAPLGGIIGRFDIAVAANGTSAAVDAHEAGLPVVVGLDGNSLNLSSLRGLPGARFAGTPEELAAELRRAAGARPARPAESDFFFLDPELPRWRRLLSVLIR
jgi:surface carbohydrate biosynthesis protein (TIGR04326 family)